MFEWLVPRDLVFGYIHSHETYLGKVELDFGEPETAHRW